MQIMILSLLSLSFIACSGMRQKTTSKTTDKRGIASPTTENEKISIGKCKGGLPVQDFNCADTLAGLPSLYGQNFRITPVYIDVSTYKSGSFVKSKTYVISPSVCTTTKEKSKAIKMAKKIKNECLIFRRITRQNNKIID